MVEINQIIMNANVIIEGIAFEVINENGIKKILASDLYNPSYRASFVVRGQELILSVSSFREYAREQVLSEAIRINSHLLLSEAQDA